MVRIFCCSNFQVRGQNPTVWPFKQNLQAVLLHGTICTSLPSLNIEILKPLAIYVSERVIHETHQGQFIKNQNHIIRERVKLMRKTTQNFHVLCIQALSQHQHLVPVRKPSVQDKLFYDQQTCQLSQFCRESHSLFGNIICYIVE